MEISDSPHQLTCPHCGEAKYLLTILSGNTFAGELWSDSRQYFPMMCYYASIQRCPHCGHYYYYSDGNPTDHPIVIKPSKGGLFFNKKKMERQLAEEARKNGFGELTYKELEEAEKDIVTPDISNENLHNYLLGFIFAYNDARYGRAETQKETIPPYYQQRFNDFARRLIECIGKDTVLTAELWREIGFFDKAIEICNKRISEDPSLVVARQILKRAELKDIDAFRITRE